MTEISDFVASREIVEVVHFTSNHGFVGCLTEGGVLSRRRLPEHKHLSFVSAPTSQTRQEASEFFDKSEDWLDYVNLSISEINSRYFEIASTKWHIGDDRWWIIMSFSVDLLGDEGVYFTTTNNVYVPYVRRARGVSGLAAMFEEPIRRKADWSARRGSRESRLTTCEQAEVLYPQMLPMTYLQRIYVRTDDQHDLAIGWLEMFGFSNILVDISPSKFVGRRN